MLNETQARAGNVSPSATYHYHLAIALKENGDKDGSRRELLTAIRLSEQENAPFPQLEEAKKTLATM
jgi:Flp pilus assembly protein TadD